jgi:excisionase family DNA binding protein
MYKTKEFAKLINVTTQTLRNWEKEGKIKSFRTPGNHRRYDKEELLKIMKKG